MKNTIPSHLCPRAGRRLEKKDNYIITENWKKGKT
nr:MAG TPA: Mating hormone A-factor 1&2 [Caudoviricetes sp.]